MIVHFLFVFFFFKVYAESYTYKTHTILKEDY